MRRLTCLLAASLAWAQARGGAFIFTEESIGGAVRPDLVTHPANYDGSGGAVTVRVCIDPASANRNAMQTAVRNAIDRYNLFVPASPNLLLGGDNDLPGSGAIDFESVLVHELGHCLGLNHPNAATESGLASASQDYTKALPGPDQAFDVLPGLDGVEGSPDDPRGDDVNLHYFEIGVNDPFREPVVVDAQTYSRDLDDLPPGDRFAANADRQVADEVYGVADSEAVMQQGTFVDEAQRYLAVDDINTLRYARTGLDRLAGTADDYTVELTYGGISDSSLCDVSVSFDSSRTGFAVCQTMASVDLGEEAAFLTGAEAYFNAGFNWHFTDRRIPLPAQDQAAVLPGGSVDRLTSGAASLLANDVHPEGRELVVTAGRTFGGPAHGTVALAADGTFSYQHDGGGADADGFVYEVCVDGTKSCAHQRVRIAITASANAAPETGDDALLVPEGGTAEALEGGAESLLDNDRDGNGDALAVDTDPAAPPMNGTLELFADGRFVYRHDGSETASDAFAYTVCDDGSPVLCATGQVAVAIRLVNDPVEAVNDTLGERQEDETPFLLQSSALLANDSAGEGEAAQSLAITAVANPLGGSAVLEGSGVRFTLAPDFFGTAGFDYEVTDDGETGGLADPKSASAEVRFTVLPVNDVPLLTDDDLDPVEEDTGPLLIAAATLLANDAPGPDNEADQVLTLIAVDQPVGGTVSLSGGTVTFTPTADFSGEASFRYWARDDGVTGSSVRRERASATVRIPIDPVNDLPRARGDAIAVLPGGTAVSLTSGASTVLANDADADGDPVVAALATGPAAGSASLADDGTFSYQHQGDGPGFDAFDYRTCEAADAQRCSTASVQVVIVDPGVATCAPGASLATVGTPFVADASLLFPADSGSFAATGLPPGLAIDGDSGVISGIPTASAAGASPYRVEVTSGSASAAVQLTVGTERQAIHFAGFEAECLAARSRPGRSRDGATR